MTTFRPTLEPGGDALPVVGRDREFVQLRAALDSAIDGRGSVALLGGEAGIGKTTLAELLCAEAEARGALVLTGRCYDLTDTAPFASWVELFGDYPSNSSLPDIPPPVARCEIGEIAASQTALFQLIRQFLEDVASRTTTVLFLDDQHWADDASLDLLRYLARAVTELPVLILVAYRADEIAAPHYLSRLLPTLVRESKVLRINIHALVSDDLWALIRPRYQLGAADEARLTSFLFDRSEGNPFFVVEVLQTLEAAPALARTEALAARLASPAAARGGEQEASSPLDSVAPGEAFPVDLSKREIDVLRLLPAGHTNQEIANLLFLSPKTVENHISRILAKTNLPNRSAAAAFAERHNLV